MFIIMITISTTEHTASNAAEEIGCALATHATAPRQVLPIGNILLHTDEAHGYPQCGEAPWVWLSGVSYCPQRLLSPNSKSTVHVPI